MSASGQHSDEVLKDNHMKASQSARSARRENLFQVQNLKRSSTERARRAPKVFWEDAEGLSPLETKQAESLGRSSASFHAECKRASGPRINYISKDQEG